MLPAYIGDLCGEGKVVDGDRVIIQSVNLTRVFNVQYYSSLYTHRTPRSISGTWHVWHELFSLHKINRPDRIWAPEIGYDVAVKIRFLTNQSPFLLVSCNWKKRPLVQSILTPLNSKMFRTWFAYTSIYQPFRKKI